MKDYVSSVDDFVAPFENFLEESIMEEDFMLANDVEFSDDENDDAEELKQDFIDEGKYRIFAYNFRGNYSNLKVENVEILIHSFPIMAISYYIN